MRYQSRWQTPKQESENGEYVKLSPTNIFYSNPGTNFVPDLDLFECLLIELTSQAPRSKLHILAWKKTFLMAIQKKTMAEDKIA